MEIKAGVRYSKREHKYKVLLLYSTLYWGLPVLLTLRPFLKAADS